jgi:hypothetical protein
VGFLESFCRNRKLPAMVGILENQTQIKKRITMIVSYRKYSKTMMLFSTAMLVIIGVILFSLAGFAKAKHEVTGLEPSIVQTLPFEVSKETAKEDNVVMHENKTVISAEEIQNASNILQEEVDDAEVGQKKQTPQTQEATVRIQEKNIEHEKEVVKLSDIAQKTLIVSQDKVIDSRIVQEKQNQQTQEAMVEVQEENIKDDIKIVATESSKKAPAEVLKVFREVYNISDENKDILI